MRWGGVRIRSSCKCHWVPHKPQSTISKSSLSTWVMGFRTYLGIQYSWRRSLYTLVIGLVGARIDRHCFHLKNCQNGVLEVYRLWSRRGLNRKAPRGPEKGSVNVYSHYICIQTISFRKKIYRGNEIYRHVCYSTSEKVDGNIPEAFMRKASEVHEVWLFMRKTVVWIWCWGIYMVGVNAELIHISNKFYVSSNRRAGLWNYCFESVHPRRRCKEILISILGGYRQNHRSSFTVWLCRFLRKASNCYHFLLLILLDTCC